MADRHDVLAEFKRVAAELGYIPTRREYLSFPGRKYGETAMYSAFGSYNDLKAAAGYQEPEDKDHHKAFKGIKSKRLITDSLVIHEIDLKELFDKAGNPPTLKMAVMPDTHVEYMDKAAVNCFIKFLKWYDPHLFLHLGDFLNAGGLSHWEDASLDVKRICPEFMRGRKLLKMIRAAMPNFIALFFLEGNHEDWFNQFIGSNKNPQLFDGLNELLEEVEPGFEFSVSGLLGLKRLGFQFFKMSEFVKIGLAHFVHGFYTGVNHPRKHLLKLKGNVYYGHLHDEAGDSDSGLGGTVEAQSFACLCDLRPKYLRGTANNWVHGFGVFEFFPDGTYSKLALRIKNGRLGFCGQLFDGNAV